MKQIFKTEMKRAMSGNQISVRALNLNQDFSGIAHTLDDIIQNSFNN